MQIRFGTSGWRGIISKEFTVENLSLVTQAIANYINSLKQNKPSIIIGYDTRFMSDTFAKIAANILSQNNISVYLTNKDTPTPVIAFHIQKRHTSGAINITASHNPYEYNGLKFSSAYGGPASGDETKHIEQEINKVNRVKLSDLKTHTIKTFDPKPEYLKHMFKIIDINCIRKGNLKVAVDCMHGTSRSYIDYLLQKAHVKTTILNDTINPFFNGKGPDPKENNLSQLKNTVIKTKAHIGLATDGDADRFGIIDSDGSYISANQVLSLIFHHLIKTRSHKGGIVRSITTTHMLDAIAEKHNRAVYEVPVGFKYVGSTLLEKNALMGAEESGGMTIGGHVPEKDGILACLLITELVASRKKSLKEILKQLRIEYSNFYSNRIDVKVTQKKKEDILTKFKTYPLAEFTNLKVTKYLKLKDNNFKIVLQDKSWIIIRPSGTEPIIRCYIETDSRSKLSLFEKELIKLIGR